MKLKEYFKNLFKKESKPVLYGKQDVFGENIFINDIVYPIKYNELRRCGYVTINGDFVGQHIGDLNDQDFKYGVITERSLSLRNISGKVKKGQRGNFYHVYR